MRRLQTVLGIILILAAILLAAGALVYDFVGPEQESVLASLQTHGETDLRLSSAPGQIPFEAAEPPGPDPEDTPTPAPTRPPLPTVAPTATPEPTETPTAVAGTATPTPTATPAANLTQSPTATSSASPPPQATSTPLPQP